MLHEILKPASEKRRSDWPLSKHGGHSGGDSWALDSSRIGSINISADVQHSGGA